MLRIVPFMGARLESDSEQEGSAHPFVQGLSTLFPSVGDFARTQDDQYVATCFIGARYADEAEVSSFIEAARASFDARGATKWSFTRQDADSSQDSGEGLEAWQADAETMIRSADAVVCIAGRDFARSAGLEWELKMADTLAKPTLIIQTDHDRSGIPAFVPDRAVVISDLTPAEAGSRVDSLVLSAALAVREGHADVGVLLEQYRIVVETAERLEDRRQSLHTFFLSINSLLLAAIGLVGKAAVDGDSLVALVVPVISILGWLLATTWARQIQSYGQVRKGKFAIVNALEARLPAAPFVAEWIALLQRNYESFTDSEQRVPHAFATLYVLAAAAAVLLALFS